MTNIKKLNSDIQKLDSSMEARYSFDNAVVLWRKNIPLCSYNIVSCKTETLTASPNDGIVKFFSDICKKYFEDEYFLIEVVQFEDFDLTNYWVTDERKIIKAKDLEKSIIDLLIYKSKKFYYPYASDDEILVVRVFSIDKKGLLNKEYEIAGHYEFNQETYIIDFEKMNKKITLKGYDESENAYKTLEII